MVLVSTFSFMDSSSALASSTIASSSLSHSFNSSPPTSSITILRSSSSSSSISLSSTTHFHFPKPTKSLSTSLLCITTTTTSGRPSSRSSVRVRATSSNSQSHPIPILQKLKTTASAIVFAAAAASTMIGKFHQLPARAAETVTEEATTTEEEESSSSSSSSLSSAPLLSQFLESNPEAIDSLKFLLQQKLEIGEEEDEEALRILKKLVSAQPEHIEWKFLLARLLNEMGKAKDARNAFEDILRLNPLSFQALFENALLMDRCGEGEAVIVRLEQALKIAEEENKVKEARDVRLIMAQIHFLQKNLDDALKIYEELQREDPNDFRPYFCKGMIFSLLDRNNEAKQQFEKYRQLSPKKFEVEGYLRSPLSRMKLFGTNDTQN